MAFTKEELTKIVKLLEEAYKKGGKKMETATLYDSAESLAKGLDDAKEGKLKELPIGELIVDNREDEEIN